MEIKQDDLIRFWTWCGFKYDGSIWENPDGSLSFTSSFGTHTSPPEINLDNIYKYAVPKLTNIGDKSLCTITFQPFPHKWKVRLVSTFPERMGGFGIIEVYADNPTEALYKAIMEVIKNET